LAVRHGIVTSRYRTARRVGWLCGCRSKVVMFVPAPRCGSLRATLASSRPR